MCVEDAFCKFGHIHWYQKTNTYRRNFGASLGNCILFLMRIVKLTALRSFGVQGGNNVQLVLA